MAELTKPITERRRQTRNRIYRYLYEADVPRTKQTIASDLSLSMPTVHQNLTELIDAHLVHYAGAQQSTGGRRAIGLTITENVRFAVGISITDDRLRFVAADLCLQELAYKKTRRIDTQIEDFGNLLANELETFLDENQLNREKLLGVGIAVPGVINAEKEKITLAPTLCLHDMSIAKLTCHLPYLSYVENDGTSGGYAEWFAQSEQRNMAYVSLENGVGGAVLLSGAPYAGDNRRSGEFGHMCIHPGGLVCKCGKQGCLEAYCSAARMSDDLGITLEEFFDGVAAHNSDYETLLEDVLQHLAIGVSNIRMVLDCDVVIGGFLSQYLEPYMSVLRSYVAARNTFGTDAGYVHLCRYPKRAIALGVALHFIENFLESI